MSKNWLVDLIICAVITACAWGFAALAYGQDVERHGTEFVATSKKRSIEVNAPTKFTYKTSDGKVYPIYITKNGACYIMKKSAKGNTYKMYLKDEVTNEICKELGITRKKRVK